MGSADKAPGTPPFVVVKLVVAANGLAAARVGAAGGLVGDRVAMETGGDMAICLAAETDQYSTGGQSHVTTGASSGSPRVCLW